MAYSTLVSVTTAMSLTDTSGEGEQAASLSC